MTNDKGQITNNEHGHGQRTRNTNSERKGVWTRACKEITPDFRGKHLEKGPLHPPHPPPLIAMKGVGS
jgi:hypothetical protein